MLQVYALHPSRLELIGVRWEEEHQSINSTQSILHSELKVYVLSLLEENNKRPKTK